MSAPGAGALTAELVERPAAGAPSVGRPPIQPAAQTPARSSSGTVGVALLLTPLLVLFAAQYFLAPTDADTWWHLRTGRLIVETGSLPRVDPYSYPADGRPWVTHEWLTEVLLFVVQRHFGYVGNVVLFGLLGALTALTVYATCRRRGLGEPASAVLMFWAWAMWANLANVRPHAVTVLLLALLAFLLTRYQQGQIRALWPVPPLFALWVNLHGGYSLGLVLLGLALVGETLARLLGRPGAPLRPLLLTTLLGAGACLLNPHGVEALLYPFSYAGTANASMRYIDEWQSPDFHRVEYLIFGASLLLAALLGFWRRPLGPTELLWTLLLAFMALQSVRHISVYAVVVTPLLAARLVTELPDLARPLASWRLRRPLLLVVWLVLAVGFVKVAATSDPGQLQLGSEPNARGYPAGALEHLRAGGLEGNLFNEYRWGGYLIYQLFPERKFFVDGRADVHGDALLDQFMRVVLLQPGWHEVLDDYDVRLILVHHTAPLAVVLSEDRRWREVFAGPVERLYVRQ